MINSSQKSAIKELAYKLKVNPDSLEQLIRFETAGTFSPTIKNPKSSARGLIQFTDAASKSLGYASSLELVSKNPTFEKQLYGPVYQYFSKFIKSNGPIKNDSSLFMSVFYPAYANRSIDTAFPANVSKANPGIYTPRDYISRVYGLKQKKVNHSSSLTPFFVSLLGIGLWVTYRLGSKRHGKKTKTTS